jgi:hypothetical protein
VKELEELTKDFQTSKPIFRLTKDKRGDTIEANVSHPVYRYRPKPEKDNPLSELVCSHYQESFNIHMGEFTIDRHNIANAAMEEVRQSFRTFLERNLEMKNPRQSKLYRWYNHSLPNSYDFNGYLVMVYKYMCTFCDPDMRGSNVDHVNNTVALLTAIMEKYERE